MSASDGRKRIIARVPVEMAEALDELAWLRRTSLSEQLRLAIAAWLRDAADELPENDDGGLEGARRVASDRLEEEAVHAGG
jgi:Ribbon-helix-helix protein, copG family